MENGRHSSPARPNQADPANSAPALSSQAANPRSKLLSRVFPILGLLFIIYMLGAATMFFQLPLSGYLTKGFMGARAWVEKHIEIAQPDVLRPAAAINIDQPGKTFDGYTLYACASRTEPSLRVSLIDMHRNVVHSWSVSFAKIWPNPTQVLGRQVDDSGVCIFACHLYPNGDLLVVFHGIEKSTAGYGLAKVDKDSNHIWHYTARVHHDVTVGEDGTIYTVEQRSLDTPIKALEFIPPPWQVDHLVMLSPEGKLLREPISILEALRNSQYTTLLSPLETSLKSKEKIPVNNESARLLLMQQDVLHTNSVNVLSKAMAPKYPDFKAGQVLLSMRTLQAMIVLDPTTGSVVWGACGPWHYQHDAQFLDNGNLLLFDNIGSPRGSRVLEYNLRTGSFPWSFPGPDNEPFSTKERGMAQRLPNGNTLVVVSEGKEMLEVTPRKEVVWTCLANSFITTARRYSADQLLFLEPGQRPRP